MKHLIHQAADIIAHYDRNLAALWRNQPFQRMAVARAFAAGLNRSGNAAQDPHPHALLVVRVALLDKESRAGYPATDGGDLAYDCEHARRAFASRRLLTRRQRRRRLKLSISRLSRLVARGRDRVRANPGECNASAMLALNLKLLAKRQAELAAA